MKTARTLKPSPRLAAVLARGSAVSNELIRVAAAARDRLTAIGNADDAEQVARAA
jgi:hypothetical protein